jgi:N6-adenosine-specific RNA methylase IME4
MSRPTRRCVKPAKQDVSELDYYRNYKTMGYVGEHESIDDIMQQFAAQEKKMMLREEGIVVPEEEKIDEAFFYSYCYQEEPQKQEYELDDEEFLEDDNEIDDTYEMESEDEENDEYMDFLDDEHPYDRRASKRQRISQKGGRRRENFVSVSGMFGSFGFTTKKSGSNADTLSVMVADPSWAKTILPLHEAELTILEDVTDDGIHTEIVVYDYLEPEADNKNTKQGLIPGRVIDCDDIITSLNSSEFLGQLDKFNSVLIDPPWERIDIEDFNNLPIDDLIENGYAFVWAEKHVVGIVLDKMQGHGFNYIENLCWVTEEANHSYRNDDYKYLATSHKTLLLFKKHNEITRKMDIRHQRNPDVVFAIVREDVPREKPGYIYHMIETLLPSANGFLEIWGSRMRKREKTVHRWTNLVEKGDKEYVRPYKL